MSGAGFGNHICLDSRVSVLPTKLCGRPIFLMGYLMSREGTLPGAALEMVKWQLVDVLVSVFFSTCEQPSGF